MSNVDKIIKMMVENQRQFEEKQKKKNIPRALYTYEDKVSFKHNNEIKTGVVYVVDRYGTFEQHEESSYDILIKEENMLYKHIRQSKIIGKE